MSRHAVLSLLLLLCVAVLAGLPRRSEGADDMRTDVFVAKEQELGCEKFRMPALVLSGGRLLVFAACETKLHGPTAIVVKASEDARGEKWGLARIAAGANGSRYDGTNRYCPVALAEPPPSGRVTLQYLSWGPTGQGKPGSCHVSEVVSTDHGASFTAVPRCLDSFLDHGAVGSTSPGAALRLQSMPGRVLWSGHNGMGSGSSGPEGGAYFWSSDDAGATYRMSAPTSGMRYYSESQLAELPGGTVVAVLRNNRSSSLPQPPCKALSCSTDHGSTFGAPFFDRDLLSSNCQSGVVATAQHLAVSTPVGPVHQPCNMTVYITDAKAAIETCRSAGVIRNTWQAVASLWAGPAAYSSLAHDPTAQRLVVAYERGHVATCAKGAITSFISFAAVRLPERDCTHRTKTDDTIAVSAVGAVVQVQPSQASQLAAIVAANPPGTTYKFASGLYRLGDKPIYPKDGDTFEGAVPCAPVGPMAYPDPRVLGGGTAWRASSNSKEILEMCESSSSGRTVKPTVLSGAVLIQNATRDPATGYWHQTGVAGLDSGQHGACCTAAGQQMCSLGARPACGFPNDLFFETKLFRRAPSIANMSKSEYSWFTQFDQPNPSGAMFHYGTGTVYFSLPPTYDEQFSNDSPPQVEVSVLPKLFYAGSVWDPKGSGASNVTVKNLVVEKVASYAQAAAIMTSCSPADVAAGKLDCGWEVNSVEVRFSHGGGIHNSAGARVFNSSSHHNGQSGAGGGSGLVHGCEISYNNQAGFDCGWEAGGAKWVTHTGTLEVSNCFVHNNLGDGLWDDVASINVRYLDNILVNNLGAGLSHEIGYDAIVAGNWAAANGKGFQVWLWSAQIQIQNSRNTIVRNNTVAIGESYANGICIIQQNRNCAGCLPGHTGASPMPAVNNSVSNNVIVFDDCHGTIGEVADNFIADIVTSNNSFDHNTYVHRVGKAVATSQTHWSWCLNNSTGAPVCSGYTFEQFQATARQESHATVIYGSGSCPTN